MEVPVAIRRLQHCLLVAKGLATAGSLAPAGERAVHAFVRIAVEQASVALAQEQGLPALSKDAAASQVDDERTREQAPPALVPEPVPKDQ